MPVAARVRRCVSTALVFALALAACSGSGDDADDPVVLSDPQDRSLVPGSISTMPDLEGDVLPDATLTDVDGNDVATASLLGEPLVLNFWFTTCAPCAKELRDFATVDAETDEVRFVGVNPSATDPVPTMLRFAEEREVAYDLFKDDALELQTALDINFFPVTVFVASDGTIVDQSGALDADGLRSRIDDLLTFERDLAG